MMSLILEEFVITKCSFIGKTFPPGWSVAVRWKREKQFLVLRV